MPRRCANWLSTYIDYTSKQESPESFHLWSALSVISATLGRKCYSDRGYQLAFPNQFIILVSPSALCKKSTAADIAIHIYNTAFPKIQVVAKKITLQKLMVNMDRACKTTGASSVFLFNDELSVLVGRTGHSELMDFMTDTYKCQKEWVNETKSKGIDTLRNVYLNFLGATTPGDLASMPPTMIEGGFAGRTIFVFSDQPRPPVHNPKALFDDSMSVMREDLVDDLKEIATINGPYEMTPEADALYKEIYDRNYYNRDTDFRMHPYQGRKGEHLIKVAMCIAASHRDGLIIEPQDVDAANHFLEGIEKNLVSVFSNVSYAQGNVSHVEKVIALLKKNGGTMTRAQLLKRLYHYKVFKDDLTAIIDTLQESDVIYSPTVEGRKTTIKLREEKR